VLVVLGLAAAVALVAMRTRPVRAAILAAALGLLLLAPASWAVQTLGHATNGTFPAGGPASSGFGGPGGRGGGPGGSAPGGAGFPGAGGQAGTTPPAGAPGSGTAGSGTTGSGTAGSGTATGPRAGGFGGMGGGFGGDNAGLTQALSYVKQHGGGTIAVSSQTGAANAIIQSGANVVGIGGFSGRESEVNTTWLANAVRNGQIRWVVASANNGGFGGNDGRVGASKVMAAVEKVGKKVTVKSGSTTITLYDLSGRADALAAAG
jgi:hypothetical protein